MTDTDSAGYVPQKFWNNANNASGQLGTLQVDAGGSIGAVYSGFSAQWQSAQVGSSSGTALLPNAKMMKGALLGNAITPTFVQLSGIPLFGGSCSVIVYTDIPGNTEDVNIKVTLQAGATTQTIRIRDGANQTFSGSFSRAAFSNAIVSANMVIFTGIQSSDVAVVVEPDEINPSATVAVNAVQVTPNITAFAPRITSTLEASAIVNADFSYTLLSDVSTTSKQVSGLPVGLSFDPTTGVISGRPGQSGTFNLTLTAGNTTGTTSEILTLNVFASSQWKATLYMVPALYIEGEVGQTFKIEYANALTEPTAWQFASNLTLTNGAQFYIDLTATNRVQRYYRATLLP